MFYKYKNVSAAQKKLNPIIKYKKCNNSDDCFITKTGLKTNQKIYKNKSRAALLTYLKKEGNNFVSKKKLGSEVKHLIISPISPELYNKLNKEEKEKLKEIVIKNIYKDLGKYGFFGAIEHKNRVIDGEDLEHFHIHLAINKNYDISPQNIDYIKRSITRAILKSDLKEKLGLKSASELKKETWLKKNEELYKKKAAEVEELKNLFNEIKVLSGKKAEIREENKKDFENIKELSADKKMRLSKISAEKSAIISDIKGTAEILKVRNEQKKNINQLFNLTLKEFKNEKDAAWKKLSEKLVDYKKYLMDDLYYFKYELDFEHNIYIKWLKELLKKGEISLEEFLYKIAANRYYINNRKKAKEDEIKFKIKQKEEEINKKLKAVVDFYKRKFSALKWKKDYINFINKWDENNLKRLTEKLEEVKSEEKNIKKMYERRIAYILEYINERNKKYEELTRAQQVVNSKIERKKEEVNKINNKIAENKYGLSEAEFKEAKREWLEIVKDNPEISLGRYINKVYKARKNKNKVKNKINSVVDIELDI